MDAMSIMQMHDAPATSPVAASIASHVRERSGITLRIVGGLCEEALTTRAGTPTLEG